MDNYQLLGVTTSATKADIQSAFRQAALAIHPDHNNANGAAESFARIKQARDELLRSLSSHGSNQFTPSTSYTSKPSSNVQQKGELFDGMTPDEIAHVQMLDNLAYHSKKRWFRSKVKESAELRRHKKRIATTNKRISGLY
jgi:DnaJ-class molecular chaperone